MNYESELSKDVNLINLKTGRAISSIFSIRKYIRTTNPEALLTTLNQVSAAAAIALSISGAVPTKLFIRADIAPKHFSKTRPYLYLLSHLVKWAYKRATGIVSLSEDMADKISEHYQLSTPIHTIYNPILIDDILSKKAQPITPPLPWPSDSKFVVAVGRLTVQKDFKTLLKAIAIVRESIDIKLVILGEGSERANSSACMWHSMHLYKLSNRPTGSTR